MEKNTSKITSAKAVTTKTTAPVKPVTPVKPEAVKNVEAKQETLVFDTAETKETAEKTVTKKPAEKKQTSKKAAKKSEAKKVERVEEIYVQFAGQELLTKEVLERAKQAYVSEGHRESSIKSIRLYIKPEEHMAYYVINEKIAGGVPV